MPPADPSPRFYPGWTAVALAAVAMVGTLPGRTQGLGLITEPLLRDLQLDRVAFAEMNLWATLLGALFCLPTGPLVDRFGPRLPLVVIAASLGFVVLGMSVAATPLLLFVLLVLSRGFGQNALSIVSLTLPGHWFARRLGRAMAAYSIALSIGFMAAFPLIGHLVLAQGWRFAWAVVAGGLFLVVIPFALRFARPAPPASLLAAAGETDSPAPDPAPATNAPARGHAAASAALAPAPANLPHPPARSLGPTPPAPALAPSPDLTPHAPIAPTGETVPAVHGPTLTPGSPAPATTASAGTPAAPAPTPSPLRDHKSPPRTPISATGSPATLATSATDPAASATAPAASAANPSAPRDATWFEALRSPTFWVFALASSLYNLLASGIGLFNESILAERGFAPTVFHRSLVITALTSLLGNFLGGWLATRWPLPRLLALALGLLAAALLALPSLSALWHVDVFAVVMGLAGGFVIVLFFTVWAKRFGRTHLGRIQGTAQLLTVLASAIGPLLLARCHALTGSYASIFYLLAGSVLLLAVAALRLPSTPLLPSPPVHSLPPR